jgi:hypothetical protein
LFPLKNTRVEKFEVPMQWRNKGKEANCNSISLDVIHIRNLSSSSMFDIHVIETSSISHDQKVGNTAFSSNSSID